MRWMHSGLAMAALVLSSGVAHPQSNVGFRDDPLPERRRRMVPTRRVSTGGPWPQNGAREIARRQRQRLQVNENRLARAEPEATRNGFGRSRRGRLVDCFVALPA